VDDPLYFYNEILFKADR